MTLIGLQQNLLHRHLANSSATSREQEIKINAMEGVLEEVLTCCITQEIMIDPVATLDGNVYERKQIEEWLRKSGGTDP